MKEKFKKYLEEQFRSIRPTLAAMQFREEMLTKLVDRAQDLKLKGLDDDELVYLTCIDELGDFQATLKEFDEQEIKIDETKRKISLGAVISIAIIFVLTLTYLIVGFTTSVWHPTWLIMVGGIEAGIVAIICFALPKLYKNKKHILIRLLVAIVEIMFAVFVFLILQLVVNLNGAWLTFLAMVALIFGVDTILAFIQNSKIRFVELPIFVEVFSVMLFVVLGITTRIWHPLWLLCLVGILFALCELIVIVAINNKRKSNMDNSAVKKKYIDEDDKYYTTWKN